MREIHSAYQNEDRDDEGGDSGEGDSSLSCPQFLPLCHGAPQEEIEAGRGGAHQTEQCERMVSGLLGK